MAPSTTMTSQMSHRSHLIQPDGPIHFRLPAGGIWIDRVLLGSLLVSTAAVIALLFHPFAAPDNDYASFEHVARAFSRFELPTTFKRGPVFPTLMAMLAPFSDGIAPYLHSALLINAAASIVNVILVYAIARRIGGLVAAGLSALIFVGSAQFLPMALQPLVEPTLGMAVLFSALAVLHGSRLAYAAAAFAALGRAETALLIPLIAIARLGPRIFTQSRSTGVIGGQGRRSVGLRSLLTRANDAGVRSELAFSIAALIPLAIWLMLSSRFDSGQDTYTAMWAGMDYTTAPTFIERSIREPFMGWYRRRDLVRALVIAVPGLLGIHYSLRRLHWRAAVLFIFWILSAIAVVRFGADKARYVYATSWIPMIAFALGLERIAAVAVVRLRAMHSLIVPVIAVLLFAAWTDRVIAGFRRLFETEMPPIGLEAKAIVASGTLATFGKPSVEIAGFGLVLVILAVAWFYIDWAGRSRNRTPTSRSISGLPAEPVPKSDLISGACAVLLVLYFATPLLLGGLHGAQRSLINVYYDNYESALGTLWLAENMDETERAVMLIPSHGEHVAGIDPDRLVAYAQLGVDSRDQSSAPDALAEAMDAVGADYALYTWRAPISTPSSRYYYDFYRTDLAEVFADGGSVPGFEHVATLNLPVDVEELEGRRPVQIYRRVAASP